MSRKIQQYPEGVILELRRDSIVYGHCEKCEERVQGTARLCPLSESTGSVYWYFEVEHICKPENVARVKALEDHYYSQLATA